jgi:hypothetical protein
VWNISEHRFSFWNKSILWQRAGVCNQYSDGLYSGQPEIDSRQSTVFSPLRCVQTWSKMQPALYLTSTGQEAHLHLELNLRVLNSRNVLTTRYIIEYRDKHTSWFWLSIIGYRLHTHSSIWIMAIYASFSAKLHRRSFHFTADDVLNASLSRPHLGARSWINSCLPRIAAS